MAMYGADVYGAEEEEDEKTSEEVSQEEGFFDSSLIECDLLKQLIVAHLLHLFQDTPFDQSSEEDGSSSSSIVPWFVDGYREASESGNHVGCRRFAARFIGSGSTDLCKIGQMIRRVVSLSKMDRIISVPSEEKFNGNADWCIHQVCKEDNFKDLCLGSEDYFNEIFDTKIKPNIGHKIVIFNRTFQERIWDEALMECNHGLCSHLLKLVMAIDRDNEGYLSQTGLILLDKKLWIKDSERSRCSFEECSKKFSLKKRRHHCRFCRDVFCSTHCVKKTMEQCPIGVMLDDMNVEREVIKFSYPEKKELRVCPKCSMKYEYFTEYYKLSIYADLCRGELKSTTVPL